MWYFLTITVRDLKCGLFVVCFSRVSAGFSSCATCLWIWPVLFRLCSERPTGDRDSSSTTGELQSACLTVYCGFTEPLPSSFPTGLYPSLAWAFVSRSCSSVLGTMPSLPWESPAVSTSISSSEGKWIVTRSRGENQEMD